MQQGSLGWLLPLDAAHHAQFNSWPTPCLFCLLPRDSTEAITCIYSCGLASCTKPVLTVPTTATKWGSCVWYPLWTKSANLYKTTNN